MPSPSSIISLGLGAWGSPSDIVTLGFGSGAAVEYSKNGNLYYLFDTELSLMLGQMALPSWNTSGRPSSPRTAAIGFNTETSRIELYTGSGWVGVTLS